MAKTTWEINQFHPFCGLHYTSESDMLRYSDGLDSFEQKSFTLNIYINYFTNLCCGMFKLKNYPKDIDEQFVIRTLINQGSIAFFQTTVDNVAYPLLTQPFITNKKYNMYGKPTSITLMPAPNCAETFSGVQINDPDEFEIVNLNPMGTSLYPTIYYFCNKIVETQRSIDVNVYNNQTPLIFECNKEQETTFMNIIRKWSNQVKHIVLNKSAGARAEDLFKVHNVGVEWKADKMTDVMQYYKSEFFTMLGINHTPYEKRANMVKDEVRSNGHILQLTIDSMLDTMNECLKKVNEKFGTEMYMVYTIDSVYEDKTMFKTDSKINAGVVTEEEGADLKIEEAKLKEAVEEGTLNTGGVNNE